MLNLLYIIIAILLVLLNAFFVAAEFSLVKLRKTRISDIKKKYGFKGKILAKVHSQLDAYLSACQLGITLASIGLGWVGEPAFARLLEPILHLSSLTPALQTFIAFFAAFSFISFLHIVLGELMPKTIAIRQAETLAIWTALPLFWFYRLMFPFIWLLNACSNFLLRLTGFNLRSYKDVSYTSDEIKLILHSSHVMGELTKVETEIIEHTMELADLQTSEIMRPFNKIIALNSEAALDHNLKIIADTHYSRYPIYKKQLQNIIGLVHVKDLFAAQTQGKAIHSLEDFLRPIFKVSYLSPAMDLLRSFRKGRSHFALVYKGKDQLLGFVTLDHLLHVLLGHIEDEFHPIQTEWVVNKDGTLTVSGDCSLFHLEKALGKEIVVPDESITTLRGLILYRLNRLPVEKERIEFDHFGAVILKTKGTRLMEIKIFPK